MQIKDAVTLHDGLVCPGDPCAKVTLCQGDVGVTLPCCASPARPPAAPAPRGAAEPIPPAVPPPLSGCALSPVQGKRGEMGQPQQPGVYWELSLPVPAAPSCGLSAAPPPALSPVESLPSPPRVL